MLTMIVLVNLKEGVSPEEYERWIIESYARQRRLFPRSKTGETTGLAAYSDRSRARPTST
jgi:hypothetical protein